MAERYYLAGDFYDDWRGRVIRGLELTEDEYFSPEEHTDQQAVQTFVRDDLGGVDGCTAVIARIAAGQRQGGTCAEIGYAFGGRRPVLLINEDPVPDMFLIGLAQRVFTSVDVFLLWCQKRRQRGLPIVKPAGVRGARRGDAT